MVVVNGKIAEQGSHEELVALQGTYHKLVTSHQSNNDNDIVLTDNTLSEPVTQQISNEINNKVQASTGKEETYVRHKHKKWLIFFSNLALFICSLYHRQLLIVGMRKSLAHSLILLKQTNPNGCSSF